MGGPATRDIIKHHGEPGPAGRGVVSITSKIEQGFIVLTALYTDRVSEVIGKIDLETVRGRPGKGERGEPGPEGGTPNVAFKRIDDELILIDQFGNKKSLGEVRGRPGATPIINYKEIQKEVVEELVNSDKLPRGEKGDSVNVDQVIEAVTKYILDNDKLPRPKNGEDGEDGKDGSNGRSVTLDEVLPKLTQQVIKYFSDNRHLLPRGEQGGKGEQGIPGIDSRFARWAHSKEINYISDKADRHILFTLENVLGKNSFTLRTFLRGDGVDDEISYVSYTDFNIKRSKKTNKWAYNEMKDRNQKSHEYLQLGVTIIPKPDGEEDCILFIDTLNQAIQWHGCVEVLE